MVDETKIRFNGAPWFNQITEEQIYVIGAGGIGSNTAYCLLKTGATIYLFDYDKLELVNMAGQFYSRKYVGTAKVFAFKDTMVDLLGNSIVPKIKVFNEKCKTYAFPSITICGLDNMESRKEIFTNWCNYITNSIPEEKRQDYLFIDGRMAAEYFQIFVIAGNETELQDNYRENHLFENTEAEPTVCSYKQTSYMSQMIGSVITNIVVNFVTNKILPANRLCPTFMYYDGILCNFNKVEL